MVKLPKLVQSLMSYYYYKRRQVGPKASWGLLHLIDTGYHAIIGGIKNGPSLKLVENTG
jgi:hypothetical protein